MTARLSELTLRQVDPGKLLFQSRHPAFSQDVPAPDWYEDAGSGDISLAPWLQGTVLARLETKHQKDAYFTVVSVMGLYMTDDQAGAQEAEFSNRVDSSTLDKATAEERVEFVNRVVEDLYPFLRAELHTLSGRMQGITGVMLQPRPELNELH